MMTTAGFPHTSRLARVAIADFFVQRRWRTLQKKKNKRQPPSITTKCCHHEHFPGKKRDRRDDECHRNTCTQIVEKHTIKSLQLYVVEISIDGCKWRTCVKLEYHSAWTGPFSDASVRIFETQVAQRHFDTPHCKSMVRCGTTSDFRTRAGKRSDRLLEVFVRALGCGMSNQWRRLGVHSRVCSNRAARPVFWAMPLGATCLSKCGRVMW